MQVSKALHEAVLLVNQKCNKEFGTFENILSHKEDKMSRMSKNESRMIMVRKKRAKTTLMKVSTFCKKNHW